MFAVFEMMEFEDVAENSLSSGDNTCDREPTC